MKLEDSPTAFYGIVLAVVGRIVEQVDRFSDEIDKLHHALQELSAHTTAFRPIIGFDLNELRVFLFLRAESVPPLLQGIDDEVTGLIGTAKGNVQLPTVFIKDSTGSVFLLTSHIMVTGFVVAPCLSSPGEITNIDCGFAVHA